ncbi:hypothetical protein B0H10DRAFT_2205976, partial [Mycena sp. CBHHK59/15]
MAFLTLVALAIFFVTTRAGTTIWSGSFNSYSTVADFDKWSWSNEVGEYQWYIHGTQNTSHYLALDPSFKNPAGSAETHGIRMTIDTTATWNSQMERAELIPQPTLEHQLKYGVNGTNLVWMVTGVTKWSMPFTPGTWFNFAYDID